MKRRTIGRKGNLDASARASDPLSSPLRLRPLFRDHQEIANYLGMDLGNRVIKKFADGEVYVQIQESIRGCDVFLVQPTCPPCVNDNLMELLIMIDACRRASCRSITCVIPYYGYARADRRTSGRESIAAKLWHVGTSTNSPCGSPLSQRAFAASTVQRHVRSIWQWRYHGTTTVRLATEHSSYAPSAIVAFHLPRAYASSACGTLKRCRKSSTESCSKLPRGGRARDRARAHAQWRRRLAVARAVAAGAPQQLVVRDAQAAPLSASRGCAPPCLMIT